MPDSTLAGVITAVATVITAVGGLLLAISVLIPNLRATKKAAVALSEVHTIVNQQRTDAQRYQVALVEALRKAGVDVPADQSVMVAPPGQTDPAPL